MARVSRTVGIFGGFVAVVGAALYPIYFRPLLQPEQYRQAERAGLVQPGEGPGEALLQSSSTQRGLIRKVGRGFLVGLVIG
uniref:Small integral membrane protein 20 n=1 Tax=Otus sunia TaxID=257818 RepID=A0A8C8AH06_9STRI